MNIHRDILETVKPTKVLKAFIDKNPRKIEFNVFNRFRVYLSSFFNKKNNYKKAKQSWQAFFILEDLICFIQLCKLYF